jgi:hypothetical protein
MLFKTRDSCQKSEEALRILFRQLFEYRDRPRDLLERIHRVRLISGRIPVAVGDSSQPSCWHHIDSYIGLYVRDPVLTPQLVDILNWKEMQEPSYGAFGVLRALEAMPAEMFRQRLGDLYFHADLCARTYRNHHTTCGSRLAADAALAYKKTVALIRKIS